MRSLSELCIVRIGQSIDMLPRLEGCIPEELLQRLVTHLSDECKLSNTVLYKLLDPSVFSLSLDNSKQLNDSSVAIVGGACPNLRRLSLEGCASLGCDALAGLAAYVALFVVVVCVGGG